MEESSTYYSDETVVGLCIYVPNGTGEKYVLYFGIFIYSATLSQEV